MNGFGFGKFLTFERWEKYLSSFGLLPKRLQWLDPGKAKICSLSWFPTWVAGTHVFRSYAAILSGWIESVAAGPFLRGC